MKGRSKGRGGGNKNPNAREEPKSTPANGHLMAEATINNIAVYGLSISFILTFILQSI